MLDEIFYSKCIGCDKKISINRTVCEDCIAHIPYVHSSCEKCGYPLSINGKICKNCFNINYYNKLFIPFWYSGILKILLKKIKFEYNLNGVKLLDQLFSKRLYKLERYDIVTSVPSYFWRHFRRFVHPAEFLAKRISKVYSIKYEVLLERVRYTEYQWKLKKSKRKENIKDAFSPKKELFDLKILLVDDIMTTGATIRECAKTLKDAGAAKVDCYVFSKGLFI